MWVLYVLSNGSNVFCIYRFDLGAFSSDIRIMHLGRDSSFSLVRGEEADLAHNLIYCDVLMSIQ